MNMSDYYPDIRVRTTVRESTGVSLPHDTSPVSPAPFLMSLKT